MSPRDRINYIHSIPVYNEEYWMNQDWESSGREAMSWYSPTAYYYAIAAPSYENTAKAGFQAGLSYGVFAGVNYLTGSLAPYNPFYHTIQRAYGMAYNAKTVARYGAHLGSVAGRHVVRYAGFFGVVLGAVAVVSNPTDNWLGNLAEEYIFEPLLGPGLSGAFEYE